MPQAQPALVESAMSAPPATATQLVGHGWVLEAIARSRSAGRLAHAYLLTGPAQIGKFTTALEIARLLLCPETAPSPRPSPPQGQGSARGCGVCRHCRLASRRVHPDLQVLEIPAGRRNIPLQDVHEFLHGIALRPVEAPCKVYIVRNADDLAEEGANALLKTIEEPPPLVTLLLTAPDPASVLPTIVSRCQVIRLRPVASDEISSHLMQTGGVDAARAAVLARASRGQPGWAILAAANADLLGERTQRAADLLRLLRGNRLDRIQYADGLAERWSGAAREVREALSVWMDVWRDALLIQHGLNDRIRHVDNAEEIVRLAGELSAESVQSALESALLTADALERNANPRLALETYLLLLPRLPS
jgi:DNA polymerase-3 subunit delta'